MTKEIETLKDLKDEELRSTYLSIFNKQTFDYQIRLAAFVTLQQELTLKDYKEKVKGTIDKLTSQGLVHANYLKRELGL